MEVERVVGDVWTAMLRQMILDSIGCHLGIHLDATSH